MKIHYTIFFLAFINVIIHVSCNPVPEMETPVFIHKSENQKSSNLPMVGTTQVITNTVVQPHQLGKII